MVRCSIPRCLYYADTRQTPQLPASSKHTTVVSTFLTRQRGKLLPLFSGGVILTEAAMPVGNPRSPWGKPSRSLGGSGTTLSSAQN